MARPYSGRLARMRLAFASLVLVFLFVNALAMLRMVQDSPLATGTRPPAAR